VIGVISSPSQFVTLGGGFLKTYYTIFDQKNSAIGLALNDRTDVEIVSFLPLLSVVLPVGAVCIILFLSVFSLVRNAREKKAQLEKQVENRQSVASSVDENLYQGLNDNNDESMTKGIN
jgi:flagellar biosynthesis/type III secretory pathway M-ring protein FliF/YscJ